MVVEMPAAVDRAQVAGAELRADQTAGAESVHSYAAGRELVGPALYADSLQLVHVGQHQADCGGYAIGEFRQGGHGGNSVTEQHNVLKFILRV